MFVKLPGQQEARVSDRLVSTMDVVPTIAHVLGAELPWKVDGASMVADVFTQRDVIEVHGFSPSGPLRFNPDPFGQPPADRTKIRALGVGTPLEDTAIAGRHAELIGRELTTLPVAGAAAQGVRLTAASLPQFERIDLNSGFLPALVRGHVRTNKTRVAELDLAIALNDRVRTTTTTVARSPGLGYFSALLPESALSPGNQRPSGIRCRRVHWVASSVSRRHTHRAARAHRSRRDRSRTARGQREWDSVDPAGCGPRMG